jgi:diguanylate cyclase (GGDEF)-like protein
MTTLGRNWNIRTQVLTMTLPLFLVLLGIIGVFFYSFWQVSRISRSMERNQVAASRAMKLFQDMGMMSSSAQNYVITRNAGYERNYEDDSRLVLEDSDALADVASNFPSAGPGVEAIRNMASEWKAQTADPMIKAASRGRSAGAAEILLKGSHQFTAVQKELVQLSDDCQARSAVGTSTIQRTVRRVFFWGISLATLFGLLLLAVVAMLSHRITKPILQLIESSDQVRQGDFAPSLPPDSTNEFGMLSRSFFQMTQALLEDREELAAIKRFSEVVTECTTENEVYDQILYALRSRFHPHQVIIFKLRPEEDYLEVVTSLRPLPEDVKEWPVIEGKQSCKAVRTGRPFRVNDISIEPLCPGQFALPESGSYYCGPLIAGGIIIGAVRLQNEVGFWTPERESLLESYLSTTASVLSNLQLLQTMSEQANIDPLTGLYNRRFCMDYARKLMAMARRKNTPLGFLMLDLDHFKSINDVHGHEVGDRVLKRFARIVTQSMRETNLTARLGGEEFVVLLPDTGADACKLVAERIRKAVLNMNMPQVKEKPLPAMTVSLGIAVFPEHGTTLEEMLLASDRALYESKRSGRNRSTLFMKEPETFG